jgi:signal transduction histidine kinase
LLHAVPFLENTQACLRCHGRREDAPPRLRALYPGSGGFNERVGYIRAVEIIQAPIHEELFGAAILSASLMGGLLTLGSLFIFNGLLRRQVKGRTLDLEREVEERRTAQNDLIASRKRLSEALCLARLGHWRLDADANLFTFTDEFYCMLHTNAQKMGGYTMTPVEYANRFVPPEDRHMVADEIQMALETPDPFFQAQIEHRVVFADGEPGHLLVRYHVEKDEQGRTVATCGVNQDITERKTAEEEAREAKAQLLHAQKLESLGCLAGGVAHDMNNVLGAILGMASANIAAQPEGSSTQRALETIIKAAERGGKMVHGLLAYARQSPAESHQLNLNIVLEGVMRLLERTTLSKIRLITHFGSDLHPILGDAAALTHAFMNLCVNAVDAMPESGTLTLRTRNMANDWIEVLVEDTGTGMPKEVLEKAMDPFFTTKEVGKGTGLGLSTVCSTVKAHQGTMEI